MTSPNLPGAGTDFGQYFIPANVANGETGGLADFASRERGDWEAMQTQQWDDKLKPMGEPLDVIRILANIAIGVLGGTFEDFFNMFGQHSVVEQIHDGQLELNDRVELLSPLEDYGSCYSLGEGGLLVNGTGVKKFDRQIGPMTGCHLDGSGRIVLEDQGLWKIDARMSFSWTAIPGGSELRWYVRVLRPNGTVFSEMMDRVFDSNYTTRNISMSVVVPDEGYKVEVFVSTIVGGREIFGGPSQNILTVHHITRSTDFPI